MHIKNGGGKGGGRAAEIYLFQKFDSKGIERARIELLRGNPSQVTATIDSLTFKHTYTSSVIAWHVDDRPTQKQIDDVLDDFEKMAYAGLQGNQYNYYAVLHGEKDGGVHIHIISPRVELQSGKSLNIAPPNWQKAFDPVRDKHNVLNDWRRPDDGSQVRLVNDKGFMKYSQMPYSIAKKELHRQVMQSYDEGNLQNADDVEKFLSTIPNVTVDRRKGKGGDKILRVYVKGHKKAMRLEGAVFYRNFSAKEFENKKKMPSLTREQKIKELARLEKNIKEQESKRIKHNQRVYALPKVRDVQQNEIKENHDPVRERVIRNCESATDDIQREIRGNNGYSHEGFGELQNLIERIGNRLEGWISEVGNKIKGVINEIKKVELIEKYKSKLVSKNRHKNINKQR